MAEMQKIKVQDNIEFAYCDSGAPSTGGDYTTIILIHGHTYHSGTFSPMLEAANSLGYRFIAPNRRLYPGSTPYTKEETDAFKSTNSPEGNLQAFLKQGEYLLLFVNNVIKELSLKKVILTGWSLGTAYLGATICGILTVEEEVKARLCATVKSIVIWEPPATVFGIQDPPSGGWIPLYDETLAPEERGPAFVQWLVQYYPHLNLDKKDPFTLIYKIETPVKTPTFATLPFEQLLTKVDFTAGPNGDDNIPDKHFQVSLNKMRGLALFNKNVREAWGNAPFHVMYGDETTYNVIWCAWQLEAESEKTGIPLKFSIMPGANHFPMHDLTKLSFEKLGASI